MARPGQFQAASDALAGRRVLVTGASGALGEAAARACAAAGATVVLLGRRVPKLNRLYDALLQSGAKEPAIYPLDLEGATPDDYTDLADALQRDLGGLDGVLHAAAEFKGLASIENTPVEDVLRALQVNLVAPLLLTRGLLPVLRKSADASVVFVLDDPARSSKAFWGGYGIAKQGLVGVIDVLHQETEGSCVRLHGLMPGPMRTALRGKAWFAENPGEVPEAAEYASACVHLLGRDGAPHRGRVV